MPKQHYPTFPGVLQTFRDFLQNLRDYKLKHPTEKPFPWPNFMPIVLVLAVLFFGALTVLNTALVGYETVTVFRDNFNVSQSFWYDTFFPSRYKRSKPGTLCDPHVFNVGDTFTTNYSHFKWDLVTIVNASDDSRIGSFAYNGSTLETCDAVAIYMDAQMQLRTADLAVVINCTDIGGFRILASTSFSVGLLKGRYSPPLLGASPETLEPSNRTRTNHTSRSSVLNHLMQLARDDFTPLWGVFLQTPVVHPIIVSGNGIVSNACPALRDPQDTCTTNSLNITIIGTTIVWSNASHSTFDANDPHFNRPLIQDGTAMYHATLNLAQTILAAVWIDLGNPSPNNVLLNSSVLNTTVSSTLDPLLPSSKLFSKIRAMPPLVMNGSSTIQVLYSCPEWQQWESIGNTIASVAAATLSMFSTGWAILMFFVGLCDTD